MKLQGASVLDLVTELLIRLDAQGKLDVLPQPLTLTAILEETGHDPVIAFTRILGDERMKHIDEAHFGSKINAAREAARERKR